MYEKLKVLLASKPARYIEILLSVFGALLTLAAVYEFTFKNRYLPYIDVTLDACSNEQIGMEGEDVVSDDHEPFRNLSEHIFENRDSLTFLRITFVHLCLDGMMTEDMEGYKDLNLVTEEVWPFYSNPFIPDFGYEFGDDQNYSSFYFGDQKFIIGFAGESDIDGFQHTTTLLETNKFQNLALSRYFDAEIEYSMTRLEGVFFISTVLDAGSYENRLLPVSYADDLWEKYNCSNALSRTRGALRKPFAYAKFCVFGSSVPFDYWAGED